MIGYWSFDTAVGPLWVAYDESGVRLTMLRGEEREFLARGAGELGVRPERAEPSPQVAAAVRSRLEGDGGPPFNLAGRTPFQRAVLAAVAAIPRGEVRTYGEIAHAVGRPHAARAVGEVMRTNPIPVLIPCHRVVRSGGDLGRYSPDPALKRQLLESEGVICRSTGGTPRGAAAGARGLSPAPACKRSTSR